MDDKEKKTEEIKRVKMVHVPFGEMKMTWHPGGSKSKYDSFLMFIKRKGTFKNQGRESGVDLEKDCIPAVALKFKNKESINKLISMLKTFRDVFFGKDVSEPEVGEDDHE